MFKNNYYQTSNFELRVNFNLVAKGNKSEKKQIWLTTTIKGQRARVYTGLRIEEVFWIKKTRNQIGERAMEDGNFSQIQKKENVRVNKELKKILAYCQEFTNAVSDSDLVKEAIPYTKDSFVKFMNAKIHGREAAIRKSAEEFIKDYIARKPSMVNRHTGRMVSSGTVYNHKNALHRLQMFCKDKHLVLCWELFNRRFEESFTAWMNEQGFAANTIASQFSIMKVWLTDAEKDGLISDKNYRKYLTKTQDVDNIYLEEKEIKRLYDIDFSKKEIKRQIDLKSNIEQTRDLFVVACWTGLRYGDWHDLSKAQITKDKIIITTQKTMRKVEIPLHPMVKKIIKKYNGNLPKSVDKSKTNIQIQKCAELAHIDTQISLHRIRGGKDIVKTEPKYKFITNHTARRSFCTNMSLRKIPISDIMAVSGHTTEANFKKYIKNDKTEHATNTLAESFREVEIKD